MPAVAIVHCGVVAWLAARFTRRIPALATDTHLAAFRRLAAFNMKLALGSFSLMVAPGAVLAVAVALSELAPGDLLYAIVPVIAVSGAASMLRPLEKRVQTLPVGDDRLRAERDAVVRCWMTKALPDWE